MANNNEVLEKLNRKLLSSFTKKKVLIKLVLISYLSLLTIGCAGTPFINDPNIKSLRTYKNITVTKWKNTKIRVKEGNAVVLVPLYPKGFIYSVRGKIADGSEVFDALDVDLGDIYTAKSLGNLQIGIDEKSNPVRTGVFIFKDDNWDNIISDLSYIQTNKKDSKAIGLTLGILFMKKSDVLILNNSSAEALRFLDKSIHYFESVDEKLYSTTIYRLHKIKANLYKNNGDLEKFNESISCALISLMKASKYYTKSQERQYSFLETLTQEERFLLLTKTKFFLKSSTSNTNYFGHSFTNSASAYIFLSMYYTEMGNLRDSLQYCKKAIQEAKVSGNKNLIGWSYFNLGLRHRRFGFYGLAEEALLTAKKYYGHLFFDIEEDYGRWSRVTLRHQLAFTQYLVNKSDLTEKDLKTFYWFMMQQPGPIHRTTTTIQYMLARIDMDRKNYTNAIRRLESAYVNLKAISRDTFPLLKSTQYIDAGLYLCECYIAVGYFDNAMKLLDEIETEIQNLGCPSNLELQAMIIKSKLMEKTGKDSVAPLLKAIASLEEIRPTAVTNKDYEYWEGMLTVYNNTIESLYQRGDFTQSLEVSEKARSRRFLDYLGNKKLGAKGSLGYVLSQQANESLEALSIIEDDMIEAANKAGIKVRSIYQEGTRYSKHLKNCLNKYKEASRLDNKFGVAYNIIPVSLKEIQQRIQGNLTIIEYYLSDNALYTWVIDKKNVNAVRQEVSKGKIKDLIVAFRSSISAGAVERGIKVSQKSEKKIIKGGDDLYDLLFSPIEKYIKTNSIGIVPYGILNYLPFQALCNGKQYLIERYDISYIPSLSVLEFLERKKRKDSFKILAFGNPDLKNEKLDLPAAEKEVEMIRELFPSAMVLKREKATEAIAKKLAQQCDIIHFASHGEYIPEAPLSSCIRLSPANGEDGRFEAEEIFDMNIDADLVVTSACQTAIGQIGRGDEIIGLTRAFIYAGANSVVGSLWNISDEATAVLMKEFYGNIKRFDKAKALRLAQLTMIQSKQYSNPFYWAAFNITGGFQIIKCKN